MTNSSILHADALPRSRSMGLKLLVLCALAVAMTIPGLYVGSLVYERSRRAADVDAQISEYAGGPQTFLGPTLVIPYKTPPASPDKLPVQHTYCIFPAAGSAVLKTTTEERRRSLFKVPVFQATLKLDGAFDLTAAPSAAPEDAEFDWNRAEIVVGVTNARGALADATIAANGKTITLGPSQVAPDIATGPDQERPIKLTLLGAKLSALANRNTRFDVTSSLRFSGAHRVAVLSYGKTTRVSAQGDWPSPGFDGGFLPVSRRVTRNGFTADWSVPFIARGVPSEGSRDSLLGLEATSLGTSFIEVADTYQSVSRSQKYVLLFVGLVFLCYFVFEVTTGKRVHPAQYVLVGVAQIIFYVLLLSLAERIGFDWAFLVAGSATVALLSTNAGWVFSSRLQGARALVSFTVLYAFIYVLLRLEDNALLIGAIASFCAVAATMYITRKIDWYGQWSNAPRAHVGSPPTPGATQLVP